MVLGFPPMEISSVSIVKTKHLYCICMLIRYLSIDQFKRELANLI